MGFGKNGTERRTIKAVVWAKTNGRCWYCGIQTNPFVNFSVDHFLVTKPSNDDISNLVPCCKTHNSKKGRKTIENFRIYMSGHLEGVKFSKEQLEVLKRKGVKFPYYEFYFEKAKDILEFVNGEK